MCCKISESGEAELRGRSVILLPSYHPWQVITSALCRLRASRLFFAVSLSCTRRMAVSIRHLCCTLRQTSTKQNELFWTQLNIPPTHPSRLSPPLSAVCARVALCRTLCTANGVQCRSSVQRPLHATKRASRTSYAGHEHPAHPSPRLSSLRSLPCAREKPLHGHTLQTMISHSARAAKSSCSEAERLVLLTHIPPMHLGRLSCISASSLPCAHDRVALGHTICSGEQQ